MLNIENSLNNEHSEKNEGCIELMNEKNISLDNYEDELSFFNKNENEKNISLNNYEDELSFFNKNENEKNISIDNYEDELSIFNKNENEKTISLDNYEDELSIISSNKNENEKIISKDNFEEEPSFMDIFNKNVSQDNFDDNIFKINFIKNENEKNDFEEEMPNFWDNLNKNEKEKNKSQDNFEDRQNLCDNFYKNENEKNFYNDKSKDNKEILNLDLSTDNGSLFFDGKSKNDSVKENSNLLDEETSQIYQNPAINNKSIKRKKIKKKKKRKKKKKKKNRYKRCIIRVNKSFSNSDNYDIKLMNPILSNCIPLKENKCMMNEKFFNLNEAQVKDFDSQKSFSNYKYNNRSSLPDESQNDSSSNNDAFNGNSGQSDSSSSSYTPLNPNMSQFNRGILFFRKDKRLNKKRKRTEDIANNLFPDTINNIENESELLSNQNICLFNTKILEIDKNCNKVRIFDINETGKKGRKKKNSEDTGKHTKYSKDNLRSKVKNYSLDFLFLYFNKEIKKIDINGRLYKIKYVENKIKVYYLDLLDKSLKSILSAPISGRSDKNENYNKDLINKIYQINQEENSEKTEKIIQIFNLKYEEFFNYVKIIKDNGNLQEINDDIKDMVKEFDLYLEKKLSKDINDKNYNQELIELIKKFPSDIRNMIVKNRNDNN